MTPTKKSTKSQSKAKAASKSKAKPRAKKVKAVTSAENQVNFHYIKSNFHRTVHVNGVYGSVSPSGEVNANFYSHRWPIPLEETYHVTADGRVEGQPISKKMRDGIVREVEVSTFISAEAAENIGNWFLERAAQARRMENRTRRK